MSTIDLNSFCPDLKLGSDGIYRSEDQESVSYPYDGNENCFRIEDKSFWFAHRNRCIIELVQSFPPPCRGPIFDIGGGNGFVAKGLIDMGWDVVLVEPGREGAKNAKARGLSDVICGTSGLAGFRSRALPAVGLFDVLEHIEDDNGFIAHLHDLLVPKGMIYLTVPAFSFLWSSGDVAAGHFRRYSLNEIIKKISQAGFEIRYATYIFLFLMPVLSLFRALPFRMGFQSSLKKLVEKTKSDHVITSGLTSRLIKKILDGEFKKIKNLKKLPFGGSCLLAARKK